MVTKFKVSEYQTISKSDLLKNIAQLDFNENSREFLGKLVRESTAAGWYSTSLACDGALILRRLYDADYEEEMQSRLESVKRNKALYNIGKISALFSYRRGREMREIEPKDFPKDIVDVLNSLGVSALCDLE